MNINKNHLDWLEKLQSKQNNGRGISCVRDIITFCRMGNFDEAIAIRQWDGDKTRSYPEVELYLTKLFGCRSHGIHHCNDEMCKMLNEFVINDFKRWKKYYSRNF